MELTVVYVEVGEADLVPDLGSLVRATSSVGPWVYRVNTLSDGPEAYVVCSEQLSPRQALAAFGEWVAYSDPAMKESNDGKPYEFDTAGFVYDLGDDRYFDYFNYFDGKWQGPADY